MTCKNCQVKEIYANNLCRKCYMYLHRTGHNRPKRLWTRPVKCINCGSSDVRARGRCGNCYHYWLRHNREERPRNLWDAVTCCQNCGDQRVFSLGLCCACYFYSKRHQADRPKHLWGNKPLNGEFCECGKLAVYSVDIIVKERTREVMLLCEDCYKLEIGGYE